LQAFDKLQGQLSLRTSLLWSDGKATSMIVISLLEANCARGALRDEHSDKVASSAQRRAHQTGVLRQALLLSDYRSILLRPRRMPEADDGGSSESGLVSMADTDGFDKTAR
jgi:hypothetical protein